MSSSLADLKKQRDLLDKKISKIETEQNAANVLTKEEFDELKSLYNKAKTGVSETRKFTAEYEVEIHCSLEDPRLVWSDEYDLEEHNWLKVIKTNDKTFAEEIGSWIHEWDTPPYEISKEKRKEYMKILEGISERFRKIAEAKNIEVSHLVRTISNNTSLRAAKKSKR